MIKNILEHILVNEVLKFLRNIHKLINTLSEGSIIPSTLNPKNQSINQ